jgi:hypothetical protein
MDDDTASTFGGDQTTVSGLVRARKHNPLLPFHKSIIRDIAGPEEDDLLVLAKGLGLRRVSAVVRRPTFARSGIDVWFVFQIICNLMKLYDGERNLVLLVGFRPEAKDTHRKRLKQCCTGRSTLQQTTRLA